MKMYPVVLLLMMLSVLLGSGSAQSPAANPLCLLPMEPGPCRMSLERFYYNSKTNSCEQFKFGGCRGNDNKFGFRKTCEDACLQKVVTATSKPVTTTSKPVTTTSKPVNNTPKPVTTNSKPIK